MPFAFVAYGGRLHEVMVLFLPPTKNENEYEKLLFIRKDSSICSQLVNVFGRYYEENCEKTMQI